MNNKDMRQTLKRLRREGLVVGSTGGGHKHEKLQLLGGGFYVVASSASDHRAMKNVESAIRRAVKESLAKG